MTTACETHSASSEKKSRPLTVSLGVPVYEEAAHLQSFIESLLGQHRSVFQEVFFIVSPGTDASLEIIKRSASLFHTVRVIEQPCRQGKAAAINLFLQAAEGDICVLSSADIVLQAESIRQLVKVFHDPSVGMVGLHPVPLPAGGRFIRLLNRMLWELHHQLCLIKPKLGEIVAFRNVVSRIEPDTAVDEIFLEAEIVGRGYRLCYQGDVLVYNYCPRRLGDFLVQRIRIFWGHLYEKDRLHYEASSMNIGYVLRAIRRFLTMKPQYVMGIVVLCFIEIIARSIAGYRYYFEKKFPPCIWPKYQK